MPPKIILVTAEKGGVGKSTTAVHLAAYAASSGERTLILDMDTRGDDASLLGLKPGRQCFDWFVDDYDSQELKPQAVILPTGRANLDLVPGNHLIAAIGNVLAAAHVQPKAIADRLRTLGADYDLVCIDASPASGQLRDAAVLAADVMVIPTKLEVLNLKDIKPLLRVIEATQTRGIILPTMYDGREVVQRQVFEALKKEWPEHMIAAADDYLSIPERATFRKAAATKQTIFELLPKSSEAQAYQRLGEIIAKLLWQTKRKSIVLA